MITNKILKSNDINYITQITNDSNSIDFVLKNSDSSNNYTVKKDYTGGVDNLTFLHNTTDMLKLTIENGDTNSRFNILTDTTNLSNLETNNIILQNTTVGVYEKKIVNYKLIASLTATTESASINLFQTPSLPDNNGYVMLFLRIMYGTTGQSNSLEVFLPLNSTTGYTFTDNYTSNIITNSSDIELSESSLSSGGVVSIKINNKSLSTITNISIFTEAVYYTTTSTNSLTIL